MTAAPVPQQAESKRIGMISELAVLAPVKKGLAPGERRTYEERLRAAVANLAKRHEQGIPVELDRVSSIHFGRMMIIRPEQYLQYSTGLGETLDTVLDPLEALAGARTLRPLDDFVEVGARTAARLEYPRPGEGPELRSLLLIQVEFDGDLKMYMHDIARFIGQDFDHIFKNCEDFPGTSDFDRFWAWIRRFQIETDLFYATYPTLSVVRLKQLENFKRRFDAFVAQVRPHGRPTGRSMDELFDAFLRENQQYAVGFPGPGGEYPRGEDENGH
jgi:hypothetical protein